MSEPAAPARRIRVTDFYAAKRKGERWAMLTSYDQYTAALFDEAGVWALLVGDSAANNVYGYDTTLPVTVDELLPLVRAVVKSTKRAFVIGDLPFGSYEDGPSQALETAIRFMKEGGCHAVKFEGGVRVAEQIRKVTDAGIPVMGHIGFTPQSEHQLGGYRVQGRGDDAKRLLEDAHAVADAGAFGVVLEMVPGELASQVTAELDIPTVGIGAGPDCDAQVLVWQDMVGLRRGKMQRFVKRYANLAQVISDAATAYVNEVRRGEFPTAEHTFPHQSWPTVGMKVATSLAEYAALAVEHRVGPPVGLVPTMGALHEGHRSLIRLVRARAEQVVVSIFVNPLQFGPSEDYSRYPRPLDDDLATCEAEGVDVVLAPPASDVYREDRQVTVSAGALGRVLEGAARPGHFDGVLTVVLKLFHIVNPRLAGFGQKDAQQLACIRQMVLDLNLDIDVVGAPIVRDPDGLATSSRNVFLSPADRILARSLSAALEKAATQPSVPAARSAAYEILDRAADNPSFELDYATLVDARTFAEVPDDHTGHTVFVVAARVGGTRLIDNTPVTFG